jgi:hypothetical protein
MANSPKGVLGGGGDRSSAHDGVPFFLKLDDGESVLWWSSGSSNTTSNFPLVSSSSSSASIAVSVAEISARQWRLGQRRQLSLGLKYARYRALFIGDFG